MSLPTPRPGPIVVVGSVNMDLVCRVPKRPDGGQTVMGSDLVTIPGGKGANQAVAAARLGGNVYFVGRVGDDDFGQRLLLGLKGHGVKANHVTVTEGTSSGCALILVDGKGENSIVVAPGANARVTPADVDAAEPLIRRASVVLVQLEVPLETVEHAVALCRRSGAIAILDPAPVPPDGMPRALLDVDLLTPNQHEADLLLEKSATAMGRLRRTKRPDAKQIAAELTAMGPRAVVLKLGARGALMHDAAGHIEQVEGHKVDVVDTTAAGDAFAGALAVALSEGKKVAEALRFANAAGALCCESFGAQPALPTREAVEKVMRRRRG